MKIKMKVDVSGTRDGQPWPRHGEVVEVDDTEGASLCNAGMAEPVAEDKVEKATESEAEKRRGPGRPRKTT